MAERLGLDAAAGDWDPGGSWKNESEGKKERTRERKRAKGERRKRENRNGSPSCRAEEEGTVIQCSSDPDPREWTQGRGFPAQAVTYQECEKQRKRDEWFNAKGYMEQL